jgi:hypothetical protein
MVIKEQCKRTNYNALDAKVIHDANVYEINIIFWITQVWPLKCSILKQWRRCDMNVVSTMM